MLPLWRLLGRKKPEPKPEPTPEELHEARIKGAADACRARDKIRKCLERDPYGFAVTYRSVNYLGLEHSFPVEKEDVEALLRIAEKRARRLSEDVCE